MDSDELIHHINSELTRTQRQLNILCTWIQLRFNDDPTLPKNLLFSEDNAQYSSNQQEINSLKNLSNMDWDTQHDPDVDPFGDVTSKHEPLEIKLDTDDDIPVQFTSSSRSHPCQFCSEVFTSERFLSQHQVQFHYRQILPNENSPLSATWIPSKNINKRTVERQRVAPRIEENFGDRDYNPWDQFWDKPIHRKPYNKKRKTSVPVQEKFSCPSCDRTFTTRQNMKSHIFNIHRENYETVTGCQLDSPCPDCEKVFSGSYSLLIHISRVHPKTYEAKTGRARNIKCTICDMSFYSEIKRKLHVEKVHTNGSRVQLKRKRKYPCLACNKSFTSDQGKKMHMRKEHVEIYKREVVSALNTPCPECERKFNCQMSLVVHQSRMHPETYEKVTGKVRMYKCTDCECACYTSRALKIHMNKFHPTSFCIV